MDSNVDFLCEFYCLNYRNVERKKSMIDRFVKLDISCNFYDGVCLEEDERIKKFNMGCSSCMYGHLDMIYQFYNNTNKPYGIFCEDDIFIHKDFKDLLSIIIKDFEKMKLDVLLFGYLCTFKISEQYHDFHLKDISISYSDSFPYKYHNYNNDIWGTQMYMISRENAKKILDKYYVGYLEKQINDPSLQPFSADWTITKDGNRALLFPLITIEDGKTNHEHPGQHNLHFFSYYNNYIEGVHI